MSSTKEDIGIRIRILRTRFGLTQEEFAKSVGFSRAYIADIETGRAKPSLELLVNIVDKYHISMEWIIMGKEIPSTPLACLEDPELETMIDALRGFWRESDEEKRTWLKLQFWAALPLVADWYTKKRHKGEDAVAGA